FAHRAAAALLVLAAVEEAAVLRPGHIHEDLEPEGLRGVEEVAGGDVVDADGIRAEPADEAEVALEEVPLGKLDAALGLGCEGAVRDSLHPELLVAETEELPVELDAAPAARARPDRCPAWGMILHQTVQPRRVVGGLLESLRRLCQVEQGQDSPSLMRLRLPRPWSVRD